jgi:hypothetical protein
MISSLLRVDGMRLARIVAGMSSSEPVPIVRCRLSGLDPAAASNTRYIPLAEFGLWKHLMETRHHRDVAVDIVSVWIAEDAARWNSGFAAEDLDPVLRVRLDVAGPNGVSIPVERYFPAETYPVAQEALLAHFEGVSHIDRVVATPGYFVPASKAPSEQGEALLQGVY